MPIQVMKVHGPVAEVGSLRKASTSLAAGITETGGLGLPRSWQFLPDLCHFRQDLTLRVAVKHVLEIYKSMGRVCATCG